MCTVRIEIPPCVKGTTYKGIFRSVHIRVIYTSETRYANSLGCGQDPGLVCAKGSF